MLPELLPWLAVLGLLVLRPNRGTQAWWIGLPLLILLAVELGLRTALEGSLPSAVLDALFSVARALAFGVAAVWLIAPFLVSDSRFLIFLKILLVLTPFALLTYAGRQGGGESGGEVFAALVLLGLFGLMLVSALSLAGWSCRHHFHPLGLSIALLGWLAVCSSTVLLPFACFAAVDAGGEAWAIFGIAILASVAAQFVTLLPFLILSFGNHHYRERLGRLLLLAAPAVPPVLAPTATRSPDLTEKMP